MLLLSSSVINWMDVQLYQILHMEQMGQCVTFFISLHSGLVQHPYSSVSGHLQGTDQIKALHLKYFPLLSEPYCLTNEQFRKLPNLRYLRIQQAEVTGNFKDLLPKLRWLDWMGCATSFFPTNFHPENLVILNVRVSGLTEHWDAWHHVNGLQKVNLYLLYSFARYMINSRANVAILSLLWIANPAQSSEASALQ